MSVKLRPLVKFLGPLGDEDKGGLPRGEAARKGAAVAAMMETPGWQVLTEMLERYQRDEQKRTMHAPPNKGGTAYYERILGQWAGLDRVVAIAEGIVAYGKQADAEMESGEPAEKKEAHNV